MTTIQVPGRVERLDTLTASEQCDSVARALRGAATAVSDVSSWSREHGSPGGWRGQSAEAADHAMTALASASDVVVVALERATAACDVYADQVVDLHRLHEQLCGDRVELNRDIDDLVRDIGAAGADRVAELEARADGLQARVHDLLERITRFWERVAAAEDRVVAALRAVDSVPEGDRAADATGRVDTAALRAQLAALDGDAARVHAWWRGLSSAHREALKVSDPDLVGNTDGIPAGDRDESNRAALARDLDRLEGIDPGALSDLEHGLLVRARAARDALAVPGADPDLMTGDPVDVNLLVYQPTAFGGDGAVAVSYGDPDTADNTAVVVPGITNDGASIVGQGSDAYRLFQQAQDRGESTATIAWMGYDAPSWDPQDALDWPGEGLDMGSVVREDSAEAGGLLLADFVDGLRATDEGGRSHLSVIGHSYGSTTAANAAHDHGIATDSLTLIGSPGASGGVDTVADLGMPAGRVYVGSADHDFVTWLGRDGDVGMGKDPAQADFDATRFEVDHGVEFHADELEVGTANHTSYFLEESQSLANLAAIVTGDEPTVVPGRQQEANDMATDWFIDEVRHQVEREVATTLQEAREVYEDFTGLWR